ncbi:NEDD4-binding protein 2-like 2 isoform X1 [Sorex araneus]|uniref:NEDD4-binding protein 2-like 2 isoform X1 n=1 Tax=Sorex araneus TaxID=42254 RepID=UPI00064A908A|nr:NEDD4-binding protein 2-like 2 isoform X1 [Sorex araneus]
MPYGETEVNGKELSEPRNKKLKATEERSSFPRQCRIHFHRLQEKTGTDVASNSQVDKTKTTDLLRPDVTVDARPPLKSDDGIYSTSKAFIGPLYKPEKKKSEKRTNSKGRKEQKQKFNLKKSEIDSELSQFYKEIEELENEKVDSEDGCKEPGPSEDQHHKNDLFNSEEKEERGISNALQAHCADQQYVENEPDKHPCNGQVIPSVCDVSFTSFRPEWPPVPSFVVPHGPPLPSFNYLNIQRLNAPPNLPSEIFCAHDSSHIQNGFYENSCHVNWNSLTFDQNKEYADYGVEDGYVGFCETSAVHWKDPSMDEYNRTDRFLNQQFQEEKLNKLQKLLILLRGLPGSGKTTLSRILLGQSRDGIVFSTDDYFHHQDGYRYNVNQLGDAHDWNQNRAKQAINQGRSPVIIDNTNTQAWEMKPYVEMAIGKGYRVEFHEPETWWKFDPEELEKRNKHGVSRQKIAQMLDRYEYEMSISIVMNSVEPSHKSTQISPSEERQRWEGSLDSQNQVCVTNNQ